MKKIYIPSFALVILSSVPNMAKAGYYIGAESFYQHNKIQRVESLEMEKDDSFHSSIEDQDIYSDQTYGGKLSIGYSLESLPISFEISGYEGSSRTKQYSYYESDPDTYNARSKVKQTSISIDMLTHYKISKLPSLSLLGSIGAIYQDTEIKKSYNNRLMCLMELGRECYNFSSETYKESYHDTRMQLGAGISYTLSEEFTLRSMINFIPAGFSIGKGTPYTISMGALYQF